MNDEKLIIPSKVVDIYGNIIYLENKILGQGGQGVVCLAKDKNIAVKFLVKDGKIVEDEEIYEKYKDRINDISILKIEDDINICRPEIILKKPTCGYVMRLLNELDPVENLFYNDTLGEFNDFLRGDGNLKKKIEVLIDLSRVLARLHSKGMIYGDISAKNVFYSKENLFSKVWLIDCDNLHFTDDVVQSIYTPSYGAPEVVKKLSANTQYSDSFSFAVLAFKILTSLHPFLNNCNDDDSSSNGWDASTITSESNVDANNIPWLCDESSKASIDLIEYVKHVVPNNIFKLFDMTFSEKGRKLPYTRPSMRSWFEALCQIYTKIWKCSCGNYNFYNDKKCLLCDEGIRINSYCSLFTVCNNTIHKSVYSELNDKYSEEDEPFIKDDNGVYKDKDIIIYNGLKLYNFEFENICIYNSPLPYVGFTLLNDSLIVSNVGNIECNYMTNKGEEGKFNNSIKLNKGEKACLFFLKEKIEYKRLLIVA